MKQPESPETAQGGSPALAPANGSESGEILKTCPLCGGDAKVVGACVCFFMNNLAVRCKICELETKSGQFETEEEVIAFWNKRPGEAKTQNDEAQRLPETARAPRGGGSDA